MNNNQQEQLNNQAQPQEPSGLMKMVGQSLPFLPLLFEQFTGQKVPHMSGTMFEIQMALNQVMASQQAIMQRLTNLENNATHQFNNLIHQFKNLRLTHTKEQKQIEYGNNSSHLEEENQNY